MSRKLVLSAATAMLLLGAAGCATRTPFTAPPVKIPVAYGQGGAGPAVAPVAGDWWKRFGDAELDALVDQVLARDTDLAKAVIAVQRARAEVGISVVNPAVSGSVSASTSNGPSTPGLSTRSYGANLTASYELDLFRRLAATRDAARFEATATAEDYQTARLALIATTAADYYQLAFLNQRIALAEQSVAYAGRTLDLVTVQRGAGAASSLERAEAEQSLHIQQATLEDLVRQRVAARNAIVILLDGEAWHGVEPTRAPEEPPPTVAPGLPAELLGRRPDLRAAELRLREQLAQSDAVRLGFYPRLTLTGEYGVSSTALTDLVKNPIGTLGAGLVLPFLQVDQMRLQTRVARLDYQTAVLTYRQTLYQAFVDVENALSDRAHYGEEVRLSALSLEEARRVERLDEVLYRAGSTTLKVWLDAQETRRQTEATYAQNVLSARLAQITLFKALGGDA